MTDPFALALGALYASVLAVDAIFTPLDGYPVPIRVIRSQGTTEIGGDRYLTDTNQVEIRRSDIVAPVAGDAITIAGEHFLLQGGPRLDVEGLTWTCPIEPA